jgi:tetratricopeptide (TPR) repeat protein
MDYTEALRINPNYAVAYHNRGLAYANRGDLDRAVADWEAALKIEPDNAFVRNSIQRACEQRRDILIDAFLEKNPDLVDLSAEEWPEEAIKLLQDILNEYSIFPKIEDDAKSFLNRGNANAFKRNFDQAIADYSAALRIDPSLTVAYGNRGNVYADKGDYGQAIADFNAVLRLNPNDAQAYYNRGTTYSDKGDYELAIKDFTTALRINPNSASAYLNRGNAYVKKGDTDQAIDDYNSALRIEPNAADIYFSRAFAYFRKENYGQAIVDIEAAIHLDPSNQQYREALQAVQNAKTGGK